ncbi:PREDICTED: protein penguin [Nicrophorus vespilloides]|uniref:Protein penguin n=1 Tax=Nicrophorus vespilloides TaxID=110193 RepID=A0ABM1N6B6_NICVS|nr:PREDICTED: protein penguin [Nicrophorus vespilloides]
MEIKNMKKAKRNSGDMEAADASPSKKVKTNPKKSNRDDQKPRNNFDGKKDFKSKPFQKDGKKPFGKNDKSKPFQKKFGENNGDAKKSFTNMDKSELPKKEGDSEAVDWNVYKKQQKELRMKRKQANKPGMFEKITKAKQIGEQLRMKKLTGGKEERDKLVNELHGLLGNHGDYVKYVLTHDMARIVQYMLKFGNQKVREEISKELVPSTVLMMQSKYGKFVVKRMFIYGNHQIRAESMKAMYGNAVKLSSHVNSAAVFEYLYTTYASPADKVALVQEFFGDMYKTAKDTSVKHLKDVYSKCPDMKVAALGATKANLLRVLNKELLDSALIQSVLYQFLSECSKDDRTEFITQLVPHIVVISNSRDGAKAAMQCIWHGTNKDKKTLMKTLKEHVIELCKHEHGHGVIITLLDSTDDTLLMNKLILSEIVSKAEELVKEDWGRKVLLWIVTAANRKHFHPQFISELDAGRQSSTSKKDVEQRRTELLDYSKKGLLSAIAAEPKSWLSQASIALVTSDILKIGSGNELESAFKALSTVVIDPEWKVVNGDKEILAIEDAGFHMVLKKIAQNDKNHEDHTFGKAIVDLLTDDLITSWAKLNRACFLLLEIYKNNSEEVQSELKTKLKSHIKLIKKQSSAGSKLLLKNIE